MIDVISKTSRRIISADEQGYCAHNQRSKRTSQRLVNRGHSGDLTGTTCTGMKLQEQIGLRPESATLFPYSVASSS